jgi:hypothetical protein
MNHSEKVKILKELTEQELRREVIIPLLSKMGYLSPIEYHGVNERGKDIICYDYNKLNEIDYLSIVAKTTDIKGDVSTDKGLREMIYQVEQSFNNRYDDLYSMKQVFINEVWIITTGKLASGAQESVIDTLRKNNLDKKVKIIHDDRLVSLIDRHFETYWNLSNETKETLTIQRDRLLKYIEKLLIQFGSDKATVETIKTQILYSTEDPRLHLVKDGFFISSASSYSINIASIDPEYDDYIHSNQCGLIKEQFIKAKEEFKYPIWEIEEVIDKAEKIMKLDNPQDFVNEFESQLYREHPFEDKSYSSGGKFLDQFHYLRDGLEDVKRFKEFLTEKEILTWFKTTAKSAIDLKESLEKIIESTTTKKIFVQFGIKDEKIYIIDDKNSTDVLFTVEVEREREYSSYRNKHTKPITTEELFSWVLFKFRSYVEEKYNYDDWFE